MEELNKAIAEAKHIFVVVEISQHFHVPVLVTKASAYAAVHELILKTDGQVTPDYNYMRGALFIGSHHEVL